MFEDHTQTSAETLEDGSASSRREARVDHIVLYGSFNRHSVSFEASGFADRLAFVADCSFEGALFDLGPYTGVRLHCKSAHRLPPVHGELYRITDRTVLDDIDRLGHFQDDDRTYYDRTNGSGSLYVRKTVWIEAIGVHAYVYELNGEVVNGEPITGDLVLSGDWRSQ